MPVADRVSCLECLLPIMDEISSPIPPPYSTIIKHDRRLRDYPMPDFLPQGLLNVAMRSLF